MKNTTKVFNDKIRKIMPITIIMLLITISFSGCTELIATADDKDKAGNGIIYENDQYKIDPSIWGENLIWDGNKLNAVDTTGGGDGYRSDDSIEQVVERMTHTQVDFNNIRLRAPVGTTPGWCNGTLPFIYNTDGRTWIATGSNIQRAIDNTTIGEVYLPVGTFDPGNLTIPYGVTLIGRGYEATYLRLDTNEQITIIAR